MNFREKSGIERMTDHGTVFPALEWKGIETRSKIERTLALPPVEVIDITDISFNAITRKFHRLPRI
jgi:hypothetical protein